MHGVARGILGRNEACRKLGPVTPLQQDGRRLKVYCAYTAFEACTCLSAPCYLKQTEARAAEGFPIVSSEALVIEAIYVYGIRIPIHVLSVRGNAPYVEVFYESYLDNPGSVPDNWREYFDQLQHSPATDGQEATRDQAHAPIRIVCATRLR